MTVAERVGALMPRLKAALETGPTGDWVAKGVIDVHRTVWPLTKDSKVVSKLLEIVAQETLRAALRDAGFEVRLAAHQNHYPDMTVVGPEEVVALDIKSTYRVDANTVNGMTLGSFSGYFRDRASRKNVTLPYGRYTRHLVVGIVYSRADMDDLEAMLAADGLTLGRAARKAAAAYLNDPSDAHWTALAAAANLSANRRAAIDTVLTDETACRPLAELDTIRSVIRDFGVFAQEKWKLASDRPGSGNTANIGSVARLKDLVAGTGPFTRFENGAAVFDHYWSEYETARMAQDHGRARPRYRNLAEYAEFLAAIPRAVVAEAR